MIVCPPLPRRVRFRLWREHRINGLGIWLVNHGHEDMAVLLWRACRMW